MTVQMYSVIGLTCEHCVQAVQSEIAALGGVTDVSVELDATSTVRVTSTQPLSDADVVAALDEAGEYRLA